MGCDKASVEVHGESLLSRAVATARRAGASEVFISGRRGAAYSDLDCRVLFDLKPGRGPLSGIERALDVARFPMLLVLAVDLPRMTATFLRKLISRCDEHAGVVPKCRNELEPLAAFYPKHCLALVVSALATKRLAAREFAEACLGAGAVSVFHVSPPDHSRFTNCNAPEDLPRAAPRRSRRRGLAIRLGGHGKID